MSFIQGLRRSSGFALASGSRLCGAHHSAHLVFRSRRSRAMTAIPAISTPTYH